MYSARIVKKLSILYCSKSEIVLDKLYHKFYGIDCSEDIFNPYDLNLRIQLLEYYKNFSEEDLTELIKTKSCLKTLING